MFGTARLGTLPLGAVPSTAARNAVGFVSGSFGLAIAAIRQDCRATGFTAGAFGTPNVYPGYVPGFSTAALFGTPLGRQYWQHISAGPTGGISWAYFKFDQASAAAGSSTSTFGTPLGARRRPAGGGVRCQSYGFSAGAFGDALAASRQTGVASAPASTIFGTPTYRRGGAHFVTFLGVGAFGKPAAASRFGVRYATGFSTTAHGAPAAAPRNRAASLVLPGAFGTPTLFRSTTC